MNLGKYRYLARRLRGLRIQEPLYKVDSWIRHTLEKRSFRSDPESMSIERLYARRSGWLRPDAVDDAGRAFNEALLAVLPPGWWQDGDFWDRFLRFYPRESAQLIATAESVMSGRFQLFQWKELGIPKPVPWSATLETDHPDEMWAGRHYAEIEVFHDPERPDRDVKWCWELNRFQHLLPLGAAWRLTRDARFALAAREQIDSWLDAVRYPTGIQWNSNLEVALRVLSWARCHVLCVDSPEWTPSFLARFITGLQLHADHLERELVVHHPEGNHLLGEASALELVSVLYPLFVRSRRRQERAARILNRLVPRLFLPDGVYAEQSTGYLHFVAEFLLPLIQLGGPGAGALSDRVRGCLGDGLDFIRLLSPDVRDVPMIGDADTGSAIGWRLADFWDFSPVLAAGSVLLNRPALADGLSEFPAESFLMLGNQGRERFVHATALRKSAGNTASTRALYSFPAGGYQISRCERFSVIFDGGPLGLAPGYSHGHADGLAFMLHYDGSPVLVDPGTFLYNGPRRWRAYFRSAAAHNTLTIDRKEPAETLDTFRWARGLDIRLEPPTTGKGWRLLSGGLNWGRLAHRRFILHIEGQGIIILDEVTGRGEHELEWRFHFDPDWVVETVSRRNAAGNPSFVQKRGSPHPSFKNSSYANSRSSPGDGQDFHATKGDSLLQGVVLMNGTADLSVLRGSIHPIGGWNSRYYGHKVPACTLSARVKADLPTVALTALKPSGSSLPFPAQAIVPLIPAAAGELLLGDDFRTFAETGDST